MVGSAKKRATYQDVLDAIELGLGVLWSKIAPPPPRGSRASEPGLEDEL